MLDYDISFKGIPEYMKSWNKQKKKKKNQSSKKKLIPEGALKIVSESGLFDNVKTVRRMQEI